MNFDFRKQFYKLKVYSGAEALAAALFSLLASGGLLWLLRGIIYGGAPVYDELTAGGTIWDGYAKAGDMTLFYLLYFLVPLFFVLFLFFKHTPVKKGCRTADGTGRQEETGELGVRVQERAEETSRVQGKWKTCGMILAAAFLGAESVRSLEIAAAGFMPARQDLLYTIANIGIAVILAAAFGLAIYFKVTKRKGGKTAERLLMLSQLCLPFQFLRYYRFYYRYEAGKGLIQLFYSGKWKWCCIALFLVFLFWQISGLRKKKSGVFLSTVMLLAVQRTMLMPEGLMNIDFFHTGEMAFPMQQLLSYGKVPYFDVDPIHGMCDYFYSFLNVSLFDGSYFSQNAAMQAAGVLMALLLAFVMGSCIRNRYAAMILVYLTMPYLVQSAGVRYFLFFMSFFILLSDGVRKDGRKFLWWWVLLCILGISWNVSIGSSMAVAFLPEVLYRLIRDVIPKWKAFPHWEKKEKRQYLTAYGLMVVIGIAYIPWFMQILRFLSENAGTTLYVNGTAVFGDEFAPVRTFALVLPYLCALIYALTGSKKGKSAFVSMAACLLVISNYACVRYDEGARLAVLAIFFMTLFAGVLLTDKEGAQTIRRGTAILFAGMGIYLMQGYLPNLEKPMEIEEIAASTELEIMGEETEDPIVYVSGDSVGMTALGTGFMRGSTLNSLKNIQTVFAAELQGESYLDLTNKISHYVIFDKESVLPFTSAYNISNRKMQEKAIALIEEERPRLILVSPLIQFDLAPVSLRSMDFYTALIRMGYQPYVYEDVVYLLDGEAALAEAVDGRRSLGLAYHKEYLGMLPAVWGTSLEESPEILGSGREELPTETVIEQTDADTVKVTAKTSVGGKDIDFIQIVVRKDAAAKEQLRMRFFSSVDSEEHSFVFSSRENQSVYLLPVGSSPFWQFSDPSPEGELTFYMEGIPSEAVVSIQLIAAKATQ